MPATITSVVSTSLDDVFQEDSDTVVNNTLLQNNIAGEFIGIRFQSIQIPPGARIENAKLLLTIADGSKNDPEGAWFCEDHDNAPTFTTTSNDVGARALTTASVEWTANDIGGASQTIETPNLAICVQEVIDRSGWAAGNSLVFIYAHNSGSESVEFASIDHATLQEPRLEITFSYFVYDGLDRADGDTPGLSWVERSGDWDILLGGVVQTDTATVAGMLLWNQPIHSNHWIEFTLASSDGANQVGLGLRCHPTAFTGMFLEIADGFYKTVDVNDGSPNTLDTGVAHTHTTGERYRAETEGNALRLYLNDQLVYSFSTATKVGNTRVCLHLNEVGSTRIDDVSLGTLPWPGRSLLSIPTHLYLAGPMGFIKPWMGSPAAGEVPPQLITLDGSVTSAGSLVNQANLVKTGSQGSAGDLDKFVDKPGLAGSLTPSGALAKRADKVFAGTVGSSGVLDLIRSVILTVSGTVSSAGSLAKRVDKALTGSQGSAGTLVREDRKTLTGAATPGGSLAKRVNKALAGSVASSGVVSVSKVLFRSFSGTVSTAGALLKQVNKQTGGTVTSSGSIRREVGKTLAGTAITAGSLLKAVFQKLAGVVSSSGVLSFPPQAPEPHIEDITALRQPWKAGGLTRRSGTGTLAARWSVSSLRVTREVDNLRDTLKPTDLDGVS